ncbi:MAG: PKD domain-containing protein, partial [Candidatus Zixiibacteriota bacterium]
GQCSSCYEKVGTTDHDLTGDRCADTDPTPLSYSCSPPGGKDTCTGLSWGPTDVQNYMGYSGDACWSEFSPQQMGRMHCWLEDKLSSWTSGVRFSAVTTLGAVPLDVAFSASSPKVVSSWSWNFGDGGISSQQNPVHTYTQPGLYTVQLSIQSNDGPYITTHQGMVGAYADSIKGDRVAGRVGQPIEIDISARNALPLRELVIPITWDGPAGLYFDSSSTAGLRTDYMASSGFLTLDPSVFMRGAYRFATGAGQSPLSPGNGIVLKLFFTVTGSAVENPITYAAFDNGITVYSPKFTASLGSYEPAALDGTVAFCKAGDVNNDNFGPDLADLSFLVSYLTGGTITLPNSANANVNGAGPVNIADLSYLVSYLTTGSPSLICQ